MGTTRRTPTDCAAGGRQDFLRCLKKLPVDGRTAALHTLLLVDRGMPVQVALAAVGAAVSGSLCGRGHADSEHCCEAAGAATFVDPRDLRLCAELVYGCLRTELRVAHILAAVLRKPEGLPRPMYLLLQCAVYSLIFLERVPDHAVIHDAVERVTLLFGRSLAGVANGALRSVQRLAGAVHDESFYAGPERGAAASLARAARFYSLPLHIAQCWWAAYGPEAAHALMRRSFARPCVGVRINACRGSALALRSALRAAPHAQPVGAWGAAFEAGCLPERLLDQSFAALLQSGALSLQSAGSQEIVDALGLPALLADVPLWDACAGYGGKSTALLERGTAVQLASDISFSRLRHLPVECARLGLPQPFCVLADAAAPPLRGFDGHILLDAPCSGWGVIARRPDIKRRSIQEIAALPQLQARLLAKAAQATAPGRLLVYLTCTLNPLENEAVVARVQADYPELRLLRQWQTPHAHPRCEGMFGAVLCKGDTV